MYQAIIVIHILLGLSIIGLILMQQGKGADAGATFGGGASGSVFGAQGAASFLSRTTAILAALFFSTSLGLAWLNGHKTPVNADLITSSPVEKAASDVVLPNADIAKPAEVPATPEVGGKGEAANLPSTTEKPADAVAPAAAPSPTPVEAVQPDGKNEVVEEKDSELKEEGAPVKKADVKKKK